MWLILPFSAPKSVVFGKWNHYVLECGKKIVHEGDFDAITELKIF